MKKVVSLVLIVCMMTLFAVPAMAQTKDGGIQIRGSLSLRGGMVYDQSAGSYYIYGQCTGAVEIKTIIVTIYRQDGAVWDYVDSVQKSGTASTVSTGKYVSISSGYYKVKVTGITQNSYGAISYYYFV